MQRLLLLGAFAVVPAVAVADDATDAIVEADAIVYVGVDYRNVRFYGKSFDKKKDRIFPAHFDKANKKYSKGFLEDLGKVLGRKKVVTDVSALADRNAEASAAEQVSTERQDPDDSHLNAAALEEIVASYELRENRGVGLAFVAEQVIQRPRRTCYYATFFDVETREIIRANRECKDAPAGVNGMVVPLIEITEGLKRDYKRWRKNYELRHPGA